MKKVEFNENNLKKEEIDKVVRKVRAFVIDENTNQVLLVHYAGLYMLPGGSIDKGEEVHVALEREILEESGMEIDCSFLEPFLKISSYDKNYFDRKSGTINRLTETLFFEVVTNQGIDESKKKLTTSEKESNHHIFFVSLDEMRKLICENQTDNPKRKQFDREILLALDEYLEYKNNVSYNEDVPKTLVLKREEDKQGK